MWVTFPLLKDSFDVIESWGFTYKTVGFTWVKKNKKTDSWFWGMGHWTRANAELCLIATKGIIKRQSASVHQVIDTPIERHSKKPDIVRDKIVELVGDLTRIELFARETAVGWDSWGNEIG
jgi:N6-adenosine-specific RNA methylase IME4